jgi:hypothetical protein
MKNIAASMIAAAMMLGFGAGTAEAQNAAAKCVSAKTAWNVCIWDAPKECWGVSIPTEQVNTRGGKPAQVRRGDTMLFVTFRPGGGAKGEISFTPGYAYAKGANVRVQIGSETFTLFTDGEWAWPANANDDAALLAAMKRGSEAIVVGQSARGTDTSDKFSLMGFTAAMQEAEQRCK